ncbi:amidase [Nocardioides insulae]|uniref:amidase n=1 Tax=Nocardioides insulae TaxID=394734 RepID=UPI0003F68F02|nr:amidase family protein [Nocardioides insulae]
MSDILALSARELVGALRRREVSAREALDAHLERIAEVNPTINAVVTLAAEQAVAAASAADELAASGADLPALHGLPMTHKDTHLVAGIRSTNGSPIFAEHVPDTDDLVIDRLRRAGVIATGKNNVPEFGAGSHTFNEVFGTTTNPYAPDLSAGGSSGGLAAAIAAGIQPLGEGSDMGGSLRIPASFCNVVGMRPSYGVLPMPTAANNRSWLGRTGPMARDVDDIAFFLAAVAGPDPRVVPSAPVTGADFAGFADEPVGDLRGVRIGWSPDFGIGVPVEPEVLETLTGLLGVLEEAGAVVDEAAPDLSEADRVFQATRATDFATLLGGFVRDHRELVKPEVIWNVELGWSYSAEDLIEVTAARTRLDAAVADFYGRYDLFLSPTAQVLPFEASQRYPQEVAGVPSETYLDWMRSACVLSAAGVPALSLPAGFTPAGLPVGVQVAADHYRDVDLLRWSRVIEQRTGTAKRRPSIG